MNKLLKILVFIFAIIVLWEVIYLTEIFSSQLFPSMTDIIVWIYNSLLHEELIFIIFYSFKLIILGMLVALIVALIVSLLTIKSIRISKSVDLIISIFHPLPGIALLPLIILWIGVGEKSIIFIIIHSVLWPLLLNIKTGFSSIPKIYRDIGENFELGISKIFYNIMIPATLPYIISGIKIGWARAWRALISAEMIFGAAGSIGGIGWLIYKNRVFMNTSGIFGGIFIVIIIGMLVEKYIFEKVENVTLRKWGYMNG